jgi:hypothetical protein
MARPSVSLCLSDKFADVYREITDVESFITPCH